MLAWGLSFLAAALVGAALALSSSASAASGIAWTLFVVALLISLVFFVGGRGQA